MVYIVAAGTVSSGACSPLAQSGQALFDQQAALGCGPAPQIAQCAGTPRCTQITAAHGVSDTDADWL